MQINKIEKKIKKINRLIELFKVDGKLSQIEKDLLLDYVRKLYEELVFDNDIQKAPNPKQEIERFEKEVVQEKEVEIPVQPIIQRLNKAEGVAEKKSEPVVVPIPEVEVATVEAPVVKPVVTPKYDELFVFDEIIDLSGKLSMSKINDINKVVGINERIFTIKELFNGDNNAYSETVQKLNSSDSFDDVKSYLAQNVIEKYGWIEEEKTKKAQNFIKIVRRLFV